VKKHGKKIIRGAEVSHILSSWKKNHIGDPSGSARNTKGKTWQVQDHSSLSNSSHALYHISLHKHDIWQQAKIFSFFLLTALKRAFQFERSNRNGSTASQKTGWLLNRRSKRDKVTLLEKSKASVCAKEWQWSLFRLCQKPGYLWLQFASQALHPNPPPHMKT